MIEALYIYPQDRDKPYLARQINILDKFGGSRIKKKAKKKLWLYERRWLLFGSLSSVKCPQCSGRLLYFDRYDALCCPRCNRWHESKCGDADCEFCARRPETPDMGLHEPNNYHFDRKRLFLKKYGDRLKRQKHRELNRELQDKNQEP